jgi:multidrug efflux pump subunit AcrA (membrane-fusion protein)
MSRMLSQPRSCAARARPSRDRPEQRPGERLFPFWGHILCLIRHEAASQPGIRTSSRPRSQLRGQTSGRSGSRRQGLSAELGVGMLLVGALLLPGGLVSADDQTSGKDKDTKSGPSSAQQSPPPGVVVAAVQTQDVAAERRYVGTIKAIQSVDVRARVEGFLEEVAFKQGRSVDAGQLLYRIEQDQYQAALASAEGQLAAGQAELASANATLEDKQADSSALRSLSRRAIPRRPISTGQRRSAMRLRRASRMQKPASSKPRRRSRRQRSTLATRRSPARSPVALARPSTPRATWLIPAAAPWPLSFSSIRSGQSFRSQAQILCDCRSASPMTVPTTPVIFSYRT